MDIFLYLCIGLAVGLVSGLLGIGGGVLMLPLLIWIFRLSPATASGTTLAVLVVPVVLPAALEYWSHGHIDFKAALWIAVAFGVGGYAGAALRSQELLPESALRLGFGIIMLYIALNLIVESDSEAAKAAAGLTATVGALAAFWGLRVLGRRALARPRLQEEIQRMEKEGHGDPDYYI